MDKFIKLYKPIGLTPLELIQKFKAENPEYADEKIAYAGRLDPMAHGEMILLIGDECKNRDHYQNLDKTYVFEVLLGVSTDSFDTLGKIVISRQSSVRISESQINNMLKPLQGKYLQTYPIFSSKPVKGKPLFWWAKNNRLNEIEIPKKEVEIYSIKLLEQSEISSRDLEKRILTNISKVKGDFRQEEIVNGWQEYFKTNAGRMYQVLKIEANVSSGTYVRSIANEMGGVALDIERIDISR